MSKEDCADVPLDSLPPEVSAPGVFDASVETLLLNVWGEIFEAPKQKGPCACLHERIALWPVFAPLLEHSAAQIEILVLENTYGVEAPGRMYQSAHCLRLAWSGIAKSCFSCL